MNIQTLLNTSPKSSPSREEEEESSQSDEMQDDNNDQDFSIRTQISSAATRRITRSQQKLTADKNINSVHTKSIPQSESTPTPTPKSPIPTTKSTPPTKISRHVAVTCYPVHKMPSLYQKVLNSLEPDKRKLLDTYELQNLIIEYCLDINRFGSKVTSKVLVQAIIERIMKDRKELTNHNKAIIRQSTAVTFWHDQKRVAEVVEKYKEQMASEEIESKRSYLRHKFVWTEEDIEKFTEAYAMFGDGPNANKLIAAHVGNGVHPNHVSHFKKKWKKNQNVAEKLANIQHSPSS